MNPPNNLELQGNFQLHTPAEVLCEIRQARLDGSLRLSRAEHKTIIYFRSGTIIFAVSNARSTRLFEILFKRNRILKQTLADFPNFANDQAFADFLVERKIILREEINSLNVTQIEEILRTIIGWNAGEWTFSPLVRLREGVNFDVDPAKILLAYAKTLAPEFIVGKLVNRCEIFRAEFSAASDAPISPPEAFILSRFDGASLHLSEIIQLGVLPEAETLKTVYALWLGGFLARQNPFAAFSTKKIEEILAARISLVKEADRPAAAPVAKISLDVEIIEDTEPEAELTLEEYLERVENAENFYEVLGIEAKSLQDEIKPAYFNLAKRFHPDIFHNETDESLARRVQEAFTKLAQAYENLKVKENRETYDFKIRKELAELEKRRETLDKTDAGDLIVNPEENRQAIENFEKGFSYLMEENYQDAVPLLARAVHFSPQTARFHAYYGKSLSVLEKYRHKAETELQTAIKLDPQNLTFRVMLAEFFIQYNLLKRAEGELTRLLAIAPDHKEARLLLDSLTKR